MPYLLILFAYLLGSIATAIVTCKLMGLPDPRTQGSNNPGATNVLRFGGKKAAAITLLGDGLKGVIPVVLARFVFGIEDYTWLILIGIAAFLGHLYPIFFGFKGGKGVATFLGAVLGLFPAVGGITMLVWLGVALLTRYSSASSLTASVVTFVVLTYHWGVGMWMVWMAIMVGLLFWRHRGNISQLIDGTESKLFSKKTP